MDKSICDGLNKLYAASANLQQTKSNHILTPRQFFEWSNSHLLNHSGLCFRDFDAGGARLILNPSEQTEEPAAITSLLQSIKPS